MQTTGKAAADGANGADSDSLMHGLGEILKPGGVSLGDTEQLSRKTVSRPSSVSSRRNRQGLSGEPQEKKITLPPSMQMGAKLKLHTHLAINLFRGRRADKSKNIRPIVGVSLFAGQARTIWFAARDDDPYADQCLLEIEHAHAECKECLDRHETTLNELMGAIDGLEVSLQTCEEPLEIELNFSSPWSYRTVLLLLQYDRIVRLGLTTRHVGFIGDQEWHDIVSDSGRALRNLMGQVDRWIMTGVTREDIRKNTAIAKRAQAMYATKKDRPLVLKDGVLEGTLRARLSPKNEVLEKYLANQSLNSGKDGNLPDVQSQKPKLSKKVDASQNKIEPVDSQNE